jgi:DNA-binding MarR family transcriptional regulator
MELSLHAVIAYQLLSREIAAGRKVTRGDLAVKLAVSEDTAKRMIRKLREKGYIRLEGNNYHLAEERPFGDTVTQDDGIVSGIVITYNLLANNELSINEKVLLSAILGSFRVEGRQCIVEGRQCIKDTSEDFAAMTGLSAQTIPTCIKRLEELKCVGVVIESVAGPEHPLTTRYIYLNRYDAGLHKRRNTAKLKKKLYAASDAARRCEAPAMSAGTEEERAHWAESAERHANRAARIAKTIAKRKANAAGKRL